MRRAIVIMLGTLGIAALAGCSLPGQAFPGGPSPWLPGGAPGSVYAPQAMTQPAPVPTTQQAGSSSGKRC